MKTKALMLSALLFSFFISFVSPVEAKDKRPLTSTEQARVNQLVGRLEEIKAMDIKHMSKSEKKALRKEVKEIKREVNALSGGVYISIGALLVIILLLILLL
jgi:hypothetical protein